MTVLVGAIFNDFFTGYNYSAGQPSIGDAMRNFYSNATYTYRAPYYLNVSDPNNITGRSDTQAIRDRDIQMARACGIDYFIYGQTSIAWNFPWLGTPSGVGASPDVIPIGESPYGCLRCIQLHQSSSVKHLTKFCINLSAMGEPLPVNGDKTSWETYIVPWLVGLMQDTAYQTTADGRPILYWWHPDLWCNGGSFEWANSTDAAAAVVNLRNACAAASNPSVGDPYIIALSEGPSMESIKTNLGLNGGAIYALSAAAGGVETGANYMGRVESGATGWAWLTTTYGAAQAVTCSTGADPRPMARLIGGKRGYNRAGTIQYYNYSADVTDYSSPPTNAGWAAHVANGIARAETYSAKKLLILSPWQEQDVSPDIQPTVGNPGYYLQYMAQAINKQRESPRNLAARGFQLKSR